MVPMRDDAQVVIVAALLFALIIASLPVHLHNITSYEETTTKFDDYYRITRKVVYDEVRRAIHTNSSTTVSLVINELDESVSALAHMRAVQASVHLVSVEEVNGTISRVYVQMSMNDGTHAISEVVEIHR